MNVTSLSKFKDKKKNKIIAKEIQELILTLDGCIDKLDKYRKYTGVKPIVDLMRMTKEYMTERKNAYLEIKNE